MAQLFKGPDRQDPYRFSLDLLEVCHRAGLLLVEAEPSEACLAKGVRAGAPSWAKAAAIYKAMTQGAFEE